MLLHHRLGLGSEGGYDHSHVNIPDVDLADGPVEFALDMCQGGEMWSEDACEFNVIAVLDTNGNNTAPAEEFFVNKVPDDGEAATRVGPIEISCTGDSPCLDLVLECTDGQSCVSFSDPGGCSCAPTTCNSPMLLCN